ncbi:electron transfer flavoprotein subunit alpha/FixB family protein [Vulgatibacter incomptus]|uniref:Electron transfer flavoprotein subunit alpha n=1 Tax=Vulgatibacter incomptus TaxID=1391653 RepID=A0A0K1PE38_9BACT|nr:electron transfer flavoprotein subunit alpha/FixB family protein [Vulgatibacter incomptus]AKU91757.1 Electron transfer flavoprotein, alpha subunit [Vulgatibacter incomptus]
MSNVLVIAEQLEGKLKKASLHALAAGQQLAGRSGGKVIALLLGKGIGAAAAELAAHGPAEVWAADDAKVEHALAETWSKAIEKAAKDSGAAFVVSASTSIGKDVLPRVAARLSAGMASDVLGFGGNGAEVLFKRPMWAGSVIAEVEISTPVKLLTIRTTEFPAAQKAAAAAPVQAFALPDLGAPKTRFVEFRQVKSARPELTEARVVVSGGRGTKGDFKPVDGLADELGAAVGASRAVVDAGWVPNDYQVGQTGKTVAPELYIALGISGAIQHIAGMKGSKVIVAVNKDPDAPIFQIADYGLVGDLFQIAPQLQEAIKAAK